MKIKTKLLETVATAREHELADFCHIFLKQKLKRVVKMTYLKWWFRVIKSEFQRKKFKSLYYLVTNSCYRRDVKRLAKLFHGKKFTVTNTRIWLDLIKPGHEIVYPEWVDTLVREHYSGKKLKSIKVARVVNESRVTQYYQIVDGNHRLAAWNKIYAGNPYAAIEVRLLEPLDGDIIEQS